MDGSISVSIRSVHQTLADQLTSNIVPGEDEDGVDANLEDDRVVDHMPDRCRNRSMEPAQSGRACELDTTPRF